MAMRVTEGEKTADEARANLAIVSKGLNTAVDAIPFIDEDRTLDKFAKDHPKAYYDFIERQQTKYPNRWDALQTVPSSEPEVDEDTTKPAVAPDIQEESIHDDEQESESDSGNESSENHDVSEDTRPTQERKGIFRKLFGRNKSSEVNTEQRVDEIVAGIQEEYRAQQVVDTETPVYEVDVDRLLDSKQRDATAKKCTREFITEYIKNRIDTLVGQGTHMRVEALLEAHGEITNLIETNFPLDAPESLVFWGFDPEWFSEADKRSLKAIDIVFDASAKAVLGKETSTWMKEEMIVWEKEHAQAELPRTVADQFKEYLTKLRTGSFLLRAMPSFARREGITIRAYPEAFMASFVGENGDGLAKAAALHDVVTTQLPEYLEASEKAEGARERIKKIQAELISFAAGRVKDFTMNMDPSDLDMLHQVEVPGEEGTDGYQIMSLSPKGVGLLKEVSEHIARNKHSRDLKFDARKNLEKAEKSLNELQELEQSLLVNFTVPVLEGDVLKAFELYNENSSDESQEPDDEDRLPRGARRSIAILAKQIALSRVQAQLDPLKKKVDEVIEAIRSDRAFNGRDKRELTNEEACEVIGASLAACAQVSQDIETTRNQVNEELKARELPVIKWGKSTKSEPEKESSVRVAQVIEFAKSLDEIKVSDLMNIDAEGTGSTETQEEKSGDEENEEVEATEAEKVSIEDRVESLSKFSNDELANALSDAKAELEQDDFDDLIVELRNAVESGSAEVSADELEEIVANLE